MSKSLILAFFLFVSSCCFVPFVNAFHLSVASQNNFPQGHHIRWFLAPVYLLSQSWASLFCADSSLGLSHASDPGTSLPSLEFSLPFSWLRFPISWMLCLVFSWFTPFLWWNTPLSSFVRWIWWYSGQRHSMKASVCLFVEFCCSSSWWLPFTPGAQVSCGLLLLHHPKDSLYLFCVGVPVFSMPDFSLF